MEHTNCQQQNWTTELLNYAHKLNSASNKREFIHCTSTIEVEEILPLVFNQELLATPKLQRVRRVQVNRPMCRMLNTLKSVICIRQQSSKTVCKDSQTLPNREFRVNLPIILEISADFSHAQLCFLLYI